MTDHPATRLQQGLGIEIPRWYITFLDDIPSELKTTRNSPNEPAQVPADDRLFLNAERIIHVNVDLWSDHGTPWMADGHPWPAHYLVIGEDRGENFAVIDLANDDERIWWYDHDASKGTLREITPNISAYAQDLIAEFQRDHDAEVLKIAMRQERQERKRVDRQGKLRRGGPIG